MKKWFIPVLTVFVFCCNIQARVPNEINYQGYLREFGQPVDGTRDIYFEIYSQESGGIAVDRLPDSGTYTITVTSGVFNKILQPDVDWRDGGDYWIEINVESKVFEPRQKLIPQVYALHAKTSEDVSKSDGNICFSIANTTYTKVSTNGLDVTGSITLNEDIKISSAKKLYFDGGSDTYVTENSANNLYFYTNGILAMGISSNQWLGCTSHFRIESGNRIFLDGGADTYISETSDNLLEFTIGGTSMASIHTESFNTRTLRPMVNATYNFGASSLRWDNIFYQGSLYGPSCFKDLKKDITFKKPDDLYGTLPRTGTFRFNKDSNDIPLRKGFIIDDDSKNVDNYYYVIQEEGKEIDESSISLNLLVGQMSECIRDLNERIKELEKRLEDE